MVALRHIYLCKEQVILLHIMVRASEIANAKIDPTHWGLAEKISNSRFQKSVRAVVQLTSEERKLLQAYNFSYCSNLAQSLIDSENRAGPILPEHAAMHLFTLATQIFILIS